MRRLLVNLVGAVLGMMTLLVLAGVARGQQSVNLSQPPPPPPTAFELSE